MVLPSYSHRLKTNCHPNCPKKMVGLERKIPRTSTFLQLSLKTGFLVWFVFLCTRLNFVFCFVEWERPRKSKWKCLFQWNTLERTCMKGKDGQSSVLQLGSWSHSSSLSSCEMLRRKRPCRSKNWSSATELRRKNWNSSPYNWKTKWRMPKMRLR